MEQIRILLANPHPIIRNGLRSLLEREPAFQIIGEAASGREAVVLAEYRQPHVVLLDFKFPDLTGIAAVREILSKQPALSIIFVTALIDQEYISEAFKAGARGYVAGDSVPADLASAVRVVVRGGCFLSPAINSESIGAGAGERGSGRE